MKKYCLIFGLCLPLILSSCATIRPGEVALKQRFGKLKPGIYEQGLIGYNPFFHTSIKASYSNSQFGS